MFSDLKNPFTGAISFNLWPQLRKIAPSDLRGHISNSRTRPKVLISRFYQNSDRKSRWLSKYYFSILPSAASIFKVVELICGSNRIIRYIPSAIQTLPIVWNIKITKLIFRKFVKSWVRESMLWTLPEIQVKLSGGRAGYPTYIIWLQSPLGLPS